MATDYRDEHQSEYDCHNILIDDLPTSLMVDGRSYAINSSFRVGIMFEMMIQDPDLTDVEKAAIALDLFYIEDIPEDIEEAINAVIWFYECGYQSPQKQDSSVTQPTRIQERIFDYDIDAPLIYAAFMSQYRIDLQDTDLHWWKFNAMFKGLHNDEKICEIIGYRSVDLGSIKDKETRARYAKLKALYSLPNGMSEDQKVAIAGSIFAGGFASE